MKHLIAFSLLFLSCGEVFRYNLYEHHYSNCKLIRYSGIDSTNLTISDCRQDDLSNPCLSIDFDIEMKTADTNECDYEISFEVSKQPAAGDSIQNYEYLFVQTSYHDGRPDDPAYKITNAIFVLKGLPPQSGYKYETEYRIRFEYLGSNYIASGNISTIEKLIEYRQPFIHD